MSRMLRPIADSVEVLIHNAQLLMIRPFADISVLEFQEVWQGAMVSAQAVLPPWPRASMAP
jgi:hypothetical protein